MIFYIEKGLDYIKKPIQIKLQRINEESVDKVEKAISDAYSLGQKILPITIDSTGGCAYCAIAIHEFIKQSKVTIATIIESRAMSCGAVVFTCGSEGFRYISKNGVLMMHDVRTTNNGKVEDIKSDAQETERLNNILYKIMAENCGKEEDYFKKMTHENSHADLYFDSEKCIEHNIANKIKVPKLITKISYEFE